MHKASWCLTLARDLLPHVDAMSQLEGIPVRLHKKYSVHDVAQTISEM